MTSEPPVPADPAPGNLPVPVPAAGTVAPPPGYPYPYPYLVRRTNVMAILALVMAFVVAPAAIVLGHVARKQIRETGEDGDGLALAGLILGYVLTGVMVAFCLGYVIFFAVILGTMGAFTTA